MLAMGDDLVDRACSPFAHEWLIRQAVTGGPDGFATERVTLGDDSQPRTNPSQKKVSWTSLWSLSWGFPA
jgi:hypothetical protein